ncbi:MAG: sialate O-acetylesterase [Chthonomonadaceae bacterium]|nr:sialate O-acetylesterase [Chthonomonadaceae bacterium]
MQIHAVSPRLRSFAASAVLLSAAWAAGQVAPKPVRVFILAGQSNMEGHGFVSADPKRNEGKGSLEFLAHDPATAKRFSKFLGPDGQWRRRDDVWIDYLDRKGPLAAGYGANENLIGPELGFGWVVGDAYDEPVLLIKCAWGGKSLGVDFRPPSAGKVPYSLGEKTDAAIAQNPEIVGHYYRQTVSLVKSALTRVQELVPGSDGRYVLSGVAWHQGWNDRISEPFTAEYESNMAHFIQDMRKDLGAPKLPFVIAETGMSALEETHPRALALMAAQAAVAQRPEFKGTVAFVGTRSFWRPTEASPNAQGYHWNCNAETYTLIGEAMGETMKGLAGVGLPAGNMTGDREGASRT